MQLNSYFQYEGTNGVGSGRMYCLWEEDW